MNCPLYPWCGTIKLNQTGAGKDLIIEGVIGGIRVSVVSGAPMSEGILRWGKELESTVAGGSRKWSPDSAPSCVLATQEGCGLRRPGREWIVVVFLAIVRDMISSGMVQLASRLPSAL